MLTALPTLASVAAQSPSPTADFTAAASSPDGFAASFRAALEPVSNRSHQQQADDRAPARAEPASTGESGKRPRQGDEANNARPSARDRNGQDIGAHTAGKAQDQEPDAQGLHADAATGPADDSADSSDMSNDGRVDSGEVSTGAADAGAAPQAASPEPSTQQTAPSPDAAQPRHEGEANQNNSQNQNQKYQDQRSTEQAGNVQSSEASTTRNPQREPAGEPKPDVPQSARAGEAHQRGAALRTPAEAETRPAPSSEPVPPNGDTAAKSKASEQASAQRMDTNVRSGEPINAAVARVAQVEAAVRLENATGQAAQIPGSAGSQAGAAISSGLQPGTGPAVGAALGSGGEHTGHSLSNAAPAIDEARFSGNIVRGLTAMVNQRGGSMTMRLDPPELGQLRVQMTISRGTVSAQFFAANAQAQALLDKNMGVLRTALESQGLTVERLHVQSGQQSGSSQNHAMNDQDHQRQQHDAAGQHSRGRRDDAHQRRHGADVGSQSFQGVLGSGNVDPGVNES